MTEESVTESLDSREEKSATSMTGTASSVLYTLSLVVLTALSIEKKQSSPSLWRSSRASAMVRMASSMTSEPAERSTKHSSYSLLRRSSWSLRKAEVALVLALNFMNGNVRDGNACLEPSDSVSDSKIERLSSFVSWLRVGNVRMTESEAAVLLVSDVRISMSSDEALATSACFEATNLEYIEAEACSRFSCVAEGDRVGVAIALSETDFIGLKDL